MERLITCAEARQIDMVFYLSELGFSPERVNGNDYWFFSPFRQEKTASFKVNKAKNIWYDHGEGRGGTLIDFGILYHRCSVRELLRMISIKKDLLFSFHPPVAEASKPKITSSPKLTVVRVEPVSDTRLLGYLFERRIAPHIAQNYLRQVYFQANEKEQVALGFKNNSGGYELRNLHFKGCASPKDITTVQPHANAASVAVFEGFFSFLSYLSLKQNEPFKRELEKDRMATRFLILNSLSFFEKSRNLMEKYESIQLYLDRDAAGIAATQRATEWSYKYQDRSSLYKGHKDLNDYLVHRYKLEQTFLPKPKHGRGRSL